MSEENKKTEDAAKSKIGRRDFLQGLGTVPVLGVFGYALARKISHDKKRMGVQSKTSVLADLSDIHVALLGAGAQGDILMNACLKIPGVRFKAVCDIWTDCIHHRNLHSKLSIHKGC